MSTTDVFSDQIRHGLRKGYRLRWPHRTRRQVRELRTRLLVAEQDLDDARTQLTRARIILSGYGIEP